MVVQAADSGQRRPHVFSLLGLVLLLYPPAQEKSTNQTGIIFRKQPLEVPCFHSCLRWPLAAAHSKFPELRSTSKR